MSELDGIPSRTVTAFFDYEADANTAYKSLLHAGFTEDNVHLTGGEGDRATTDRPRHEGFLDSLAHFFMGDEDRHAYAEGLSRGGYLITVTNLDPQLHDTAVDILDREGAVDLDERQQQWRSTGWAGYDASGAADGTSLASPAATGTSTPPAAPLTGTGATSDRDSETIPVVNEELVVGKRDVNLGRVRVRSYVQETPVSEQVNLRDERVTLDRRPVDRPLTADDDAFAERTIEAEEHTEQAVVGKQARVTEEIGLRKDSTERQETVSDTVRHTEVEIDDQRDSAQRGTGTQPNRRP